MLERCFPVVAACILAATPLGCCRSVLPDLPDLSSLGTAQGSVQSTGATGTWKLDSGSCYAGDNEGFFGIHVHSKADPHVVVKIVKDPTLGWMVQSSIPSTCSGTRCTFEVFKPEQCKPLDVNLKTYTFKKNGLHQFDGDVTFDCSHDKGHVWGKLTANSCVN